MNKTMRMPILGIAIIGCLLVAAPENALGQSVGIRNGIGHPVHIWIWPESQSGAQSGWARPVPYLPSSGSIRLNLAAPGRYFLVVRDRANNDDPIGWVDMHRVVAMRPDSNFVLAGGYRQREREVNYQVTRTRQEMRTRMVRRWDGTKYVEVPEEYSVSVPYAETRTRVVQQTVLDVDLMVETNGQLASVFDLFSDDIAIAATDPFQDEGDVVGADPENSSPEP